MNFDNLGYSFKTIFNEIESLDILSYFISISENRFCCHNLLIAELISVPGTLILLLIFNPEISIIFDLFTYLLPVILISDKINVLGCV